MGQFPVTALIKTWRGVQSKSDSNGRLFRWTYTGQKVREHFHHLLVIVCGILRQVRPCHPDENAAVRNDTITVPIDVLSLILHRREASAPPSVDKYLVHGPVLGRCCFFVKGFSILCVFKGRRNNRKI